MCHRRRSATWSTDPSCKTKTRRPRKVRREKLRYSEDRFPLLRSDHRHPSRVCDGRLITNVICVGRWGGARSEPALSRLTLQVIDYIHGPNLDHLFEGPPSWRGSQYFDPFNRATTSVSMISILGLIASSGSPSSMTCIIWTSCPAIHRPSAAPGSRVCFVSSGSRTVQ